MAAATTHRFGGVDLLFANTGGPPAGTALSSTTRRWQAAFELLLLSVVRTVRLVVPSMRARGGGAILVGTSSTVKEPVPNLALSNVMRAGRDRAGEDALGGAGADGIRVNTLLPGRIATDRLESGRDRMRKRPALRLRNSRQRAATIPVGRYGEPDDFGRAGCVSALEAASYITGAALQVDGGLIKGLL